MSVNKKIVKVEVDGKEVELAVLRPNAKQRQEAQKVYNRAFREAVDSGAILRAKIESVMREQKLWDDQKETNLRKLQAAIGDKERRVRSGGIKLCEARDLAIQLRRDRAELRGLNSERVSLDNNSAEAQADNAQFNYWVSSCTVSANDGKPYFKSYEDYLNKEDEPVAGLAANALAKIIYNIEDDYENKLPENQFLVKYKFADESLHLVDKQGRRIDTEDRLVNENGRYINETGQFVDREGALVDLDGNFIVEEKPFLDDEGNPIVSAPEVVLSV